jgi:hypothetical protein
VKNTIPWYLSNPDYDYGYYGTTPLVPVCEKHYPNGECCVGYGSTPLGPPCLHCVVDRVNWAVQELRHCTNAEQANRIADVLSGKAVIGYFMRPADQP